MRKLIIFDTTLRDGEQCPGFSMVTEEKIRLALQLEKLGVDVIEAGFAASSPGDFDAIERVAKAIKNSTVCSLARARRADIDAAANALKKAASARIHTFIATSKIHMEHKLKMNEDEVIAAAVDAVKYARNLCENVEFSAEDALRSERDFLFKVIDAVVKAGATTINLPDTVGYTMPDEIYDLFSSVKNSVANIDKAVLSTHNHDDLGLSVANSLAAIRGGADQVECTINGIGERAGNSALEEICMAINTRQDYYDIKSTIVTTEIYKTSRLLSQITGVDVQPNKAIVGKNAFAHEAGIHQDGVLKNRSTYEIMSAESVGIPTNMLVLGKHSGRAAFKARLAHLGFENLEEERIESAFALFKELADKKKNVYDEDIVALISGMIDTVKKHYVLDYVAFNSGIGVVPSATVRLKNNDGEILNDSSIGDGPVDAVCKAIDRITKHKGFLKDFKLNAISSGKDAQGEVHLLVEFDDSGKTLLGKGFSQDILVASANGYINALNQHIQLAHTEAK